MLFFMSWIITKLSSMSFTENIRLKKPMQSIYIEHTGYWLEASNKSKLIKDIKLFLGMSDLTLKLYRLFLHCLLPFWLSPFWTVPFLWCKRNWNLNWICAFIDLSLLEKAKVYLEENKNTRYLQSNEMSCYWTCLKLFSLWIF